MQARSENPRDGPPRDPKAWLILVGRNAALDGVRRRGRQEALPAEEALPDLDDAEAALAALVARL